MNRYPHTTPWTAAIGFAAVAATAVTMGVAVILPAKIGAQTSAHVPVMARSVAEPHVDISPSHTDVVATRPAANADSKSFGKLVFAFLARKPG